MAGTALANGMHTSGIYSDMTVDGPEIGTLVAIVDRAKNLPNVKRMGKQNPYCAARLGKEAKKTETDKRGGQTPRWDQELRFTVHDSPDYQNLKVTIFNDDKKTDLIGEAWINLEKVYLPGGGRSDNWHPLNFKGKYAGEIMLELTYYDSRPQPENKRKISGMGAQAESRQPAPIKRRPLPSSEFAPAPSYAMPDHARGPRAMSGRHMDDHNPHAHRPRPLPHANTAPAAPPVQYPHQDEFDYHPGYEHMPMPDLPQIPPHRVHRGSMPPQPTMQYAPYPQPDDHYHQRSQSYPNLPHAYSAPSVHSDYVQQGFEGGASPHHRASLQPTVEDVDEESELPPLPPALTPGRRPPSRSRSGDDYSPAPVPYSNSPNSRSSYSGYPPPASVAGSSSGYARQSRVPSRHSVPDPYGMTPPRAHPLANEMRRSASPLPYQDAYSQDMPRALSPRPPRNNIDAIRHPVQTFATQSTSPTRKELPRPSTSASNFFSPDSFDSFNPHASQNSPFASTSNPHSPYHIPAAAEQEEAPRPLPDIDAPIVGFDGRVIDPSDHLPVHSWAPEPEKKTPSKTYGIGGDGRPRGLSGPRSAVQTPTRVSRDTVVNVRTRGSRPVSSAGHSSMSQPLSEIDVPNPYALVHRQSPNFAEGRPSAYEGQQSRYGNNSPNQSPHYGDIFGKYPQGGDPYEYENNAAPPSQSQVYQQHGYGPSALSKEMAKIDIGGSRRPLSRGTVRRGAYP